MSDEQDEKAAELGRKLGKAFRQAKPRAQQLASQAKPHVEKAFDDAVKFAKDHDEEAKDLAKKLVRARVAGPFGMVIDAFESQARQAPAQQSQAQQPATNATQPGLCSACGASNPTVARFCNQCGARLESSAAQEQSQAQQ